MPTVLVVDDASYIRKKIIKDLANTEFSVVGEAANGTDAVMQYKRLKPDLVLMDIVMPDKGGVEATFEIMTYNNKAKVILLSSLENEIVIVKAFEAGAKLFLQKPYDKEKIIEALKECSAS